MSSTLLIVVFFIQLALYLINSIGAKTINELLWLVYIRLPFGTSQNIREQWRLRRDVVRLKREMAAISAQDDFARWAKIRRQHDKTLAEYDKTGMNWPCEHYVIVADLRAAAAVSSMRSSFNMKASAVRWTSTTGLRFGLQFWHAKTPVFTYPRGWVPWYVEWAMAFPRCPSGGVSINVWSAACATVISLVGDSVIYAVQSTSKTSSKQKGEPMKMAAGGSGEKKQ
jgi:tail-anchored protein insertion receptor